MSTSDQAYQRRRRERVCRGEPGRVGHVGFELTDTGGLRELRPQHCPEGHPLRNPNAGVGWHENCRYVLCRTCQDAGRPATLLLCTCRGDAFAYQGRTQRWECEPEPAVW